MKVAIIGFGVEGRAAYDYWLDGNVITVCDKNTDVDVPEGAATQLGSSYLADLSRFDLIVRSPNVHPKLLTTSNDPSIISKVTSCTNEFFKVSPTKNIIGVTGTKGKGTTATLISKILEAGGKRVHLGGNIGTAALALLKNNIQADDWIVLELSSFQLIDVRFSPTIAVCLMIAPEHLDWHPDTDDYYNAKSQLFRHQNGADVAIYFADNTYSERIASTSRGWKIPYFKKPGAYISNDTIVMADQAICKVEEVKLLGRHNLQNICAAITASWQITHDVQAIKNVLTSFGGLPFRLELRRQVNGVSYYNDSFAATPQAPIAAIEALSQPKVLILGGFDRGLDLDELAISVKEHEKDIRKALLIGASADRLANALKQRGFTNLHVVTAKDIDTIVEEAASAAQAGDVVLLSPGFPSFDMFKNFEDRGNQFNERVERL